MAKKPQQLTPICHYCKKFSKLVTGKAIYPHRKDLYSLTFYQCKDCDAYVGTHKNTDNKPLGRLANAELREAKKMAHNFFDRLWREKFMKRNEAYKWLTAELGINPSDCHIGMFDVEQCKLTASASVAKYNSIYEGINRG